MTPNDVKMAKNHFALARVYSSAMKTAYDTAAAHPEAAEEQLVVVNAMANAMQAEMALFTAMLYWPDASYGDLP
jgi:hypothetical protein